MEELGTEFNFKARYYKLGEINSQTKQVWFVLHGYGQLAQYFLPKFKKLTDHAICIIAPEGLSHYYLEDSKTRSQTGSTRVGASWMTRENRLIDIENYITYLNSVYTTELKHAQNLPVTLLGFSQGAATVSRWALSEAANFSRLILWAGIFPNDMDFEKGKEVLKNKQVNVVYGDQDPYLNEGRFAEMKTLSEKLGLSLTPIVFNGAHELHEATLLRLI